MESRRINWWLIIITAVITGLITLTVGVILLKIQNKEPELVYTITDTQPFPGKDQNFAIYNVTISNSGKTPISNVLAVIQVPSATLDDTRFTTALSLEYTREIVGDTLNLNIPEFNPNDTISVSILATSTSVLPTRPQVSTRGAGIVGVQKITSPENLTRNLFPLSIISGLAGLIAAIFTMFFIPIIRGHAIISGKHREEQNEILAYLCGIHNLTDEVQDYLSRPRRTSYWAEADRFAAIAVANPATKKAENVEMLLKDLLAYAAIAEISKGIIYYDIARIEVARGNRDEAGTYLKEAKKHAGKLIDIRLKVDSALRDIPNKDTDNRPS